MDRLRNACHRQFVAAAATVRGAISVASAVLRFTLAYLTWLTSESSASHHVLIAVRGVGSDVFSTVRDRLQAVGNWLDGLEFVPLVVVLPFVVSGIILGVALIITGAILAVWALACAILIDIIVSLFGNQHINAEEPAPPEPTINFENLQGDARSGSVLLLLVLGIISLACWFSSGKKLGDGCMSDAECVTGLSCYNWSGFTGKKCVRTTVTNPFSTVDTSLPFNKYAFLTTHNSFSITTVTRSTLYNQEDTITEQLNNGVRALMLDVYDYRDDIWLCHPLGGDCYGTASFEPAIYTLREVEAFLLTNPSEIVTLILEDHVTTEHGLSKLFKRTGLGKYWYPMSKMPRNGEDWPCVSDMIKRNHRLLVFTSNRYKELTEGIAYQWNYMVENQYGDDGMNPALCQNRSESSFLFDRTKSLVLVNYFRTIPLQRTASMEHSRGLIDVLKTCHAAAGNRWANFLAVDYYKRSDGGGVFQATDMLNGRLICQRNDVYGCRKGIVKHALNDLLLKLGLTWKGSEKHYGEENVEPINQDQILDAAVNRRKSSSVEEDPKFNSNNAEVHYIGLKLQDNLPHDDL